MGRSFLVIVLLGASPGFAAELNGDVRLWTGIGVDTNPRRDFSNEGVFRPYDVFATATGSLTGAIDFERGRLLGLYDIGGRKFFLFPSEDTVIQNATLDAALYALQAFSLGASMRARDRRGADRDYTDLSPDAWVEFTPSNNLLVRAHGGYHRFLYWNRFSYSFWGTDFGASARWRFNKRHSISFFLELEPRTYNGDAATNPELEVTSPGQRKDFYAAAGLGYAYRGPVNVSTSYGYFDSASNSFGESFRRHRFSITAGVRLPLEFTLLASATVTLAQYPDGVYLSSELIVLEDDENTSSVSFKVVRPLGKYVDADVRYALYYNRLLRNDLTYLRQVVTFGFAFHL